MEDGPVEHYEPASRQARDLVSRVLGNAGRAPRHVDDPYVRPGRVATSQDAAAKTLPKSGTQRRAILEALLQAARGHAGGATDPELERHLGLSGNSVRPRRGELVEMGLVEDAGMTRANLGNQHTVWRPTRHALTLLHRAGA